MLLYNNNSPMVSLINEVTKGLKKDIVLVNHGVSFHFDEAVDEGAVIVQGLKETFFLVEVTWPLPLGLLKNRVHVQLA